MQWKDGYMYDGHGCRIEVMKRVYQMAYGLNEAEALRLLEWLNWKVRRGRRRDGNRHRSRSLCLPCKRAVRPCANGSDGVTEAKKMARS